MRKSNEAEQMGEKKYITNKTLFGQPEILGFGSDDFCVKEIGRNLANKLIIENHYSHKFYNATYIHLGIFLNLKLVGVLQYGYAMNPASCGGIVEGTEMSQYLELNRMWLSDEAKRNSESIAISYSIKYIKRKYPKIKWIQSFADERCNFYGIVYQACSFNFYGEHESVFWTLNNEVFHNSLMTRNPNLSKAAAVLQKGKNEATSEKLRQFRYIKFLDERWKRKCLLKEEPYPKYYDNSNGFSKTEEGISLKKYGKIINNIEEVE
jgi:hypothetical protein